MHSRIRDLRALIKTSMSQMEVTTEQPTHIRVGNISRRAERLRCKLFSSTGGRRADVAGDDDLVYQHHPLVLGFGGKGDAERAADTRKVYDDVSRRSILTV